MSNSPRRRNGQFRPSRFSCLLVADWEEAEAASRGPQVHAEGLKAAQAQVVSVNDHSIFPVAGGDLQQPEDTMKTVVKRINENILNDSKTPHDLDKEDDESETGIAGGDPTPDGGSSDGCTDRLIGNKDFWSVSGDFIIRQHTSPRTEMYVPSSVDFPIPLKYVDVTRRTETNLESASERIISDCWNVPHCDAAGGDPMPANRDLSDSWQR